MQNATLTGIENREKRKKNRRMIVRFDSLGTEFRRSPKTRMSLLRRWGKITKNMIQSQSRGQLITEAYPTDTETHFWIKENGQIRKICGQLNSARAICLQPAGASTRHLGSGMCRTCSKRMSRKSIEATDIANRDNGLPSRLQECLDYAETMETRLLTKVDPDIKNLYGLLRYVMAGGLHASAPDLNEEDVKLSNMLIRTIVESKKARALIEKEIRIDPVTIKSFVSQVMGVVFAHVDQNIAGRIGNEILEKVVRPFKIEGRIAGTTEDYYPVAEEMKTVLHGTTPVMKTREVHSHQKKFHRGKVDGTYTARADDL